MSISVAELFDSREMTNDNGKKELIRIYEVKGTSDPKAAEAYGPAMGSSYGSELFVRKKHAKRRKTSTDSCLLTVTYRTTDPDGGGGNEDDNPYEQTWDLDMTAGTVKITHVRKTTDQRDYPTADDQGTVIGWNGQEIEGVDIYAFQGTYNIYNWRYQSAITSTYLNTLYSLHTKTNNAAWMMFARGEVLYLGPRVPRVGVGSEKVEITHQFVIAPNQSDVEIALADGTTETFDMKGHNYLWFKEQSKIDTEDSNKYKNLVKSAHVAKVYEEGNFANLGLGS